MQPCHRKPGEPWQTSLPVDEDAEDRDDREEDQADHAGGAAGEPECRSGDHDEASGQLAIKVTDPSTATSRAGSPSLASQPAALLPRMIEAVLAMLASRAEPAAIETVRKSLSAGRPVRGSRMWCIRSPPRCHLRALVLDVARPPSRMAMTTAGPRAGVNGSPVTSWTRIDQPPGGTSPATAMSPPRLTRAPQPSTRAIPSADRSAAQALAVAPRSTRTPAGTVSRLVASSRWICRHCGTWFTVTRTAPSWAGTEAKSRSYPIASIVRPTVGSTRPSVSTAPRNAARTAPASSALTVVGWPALASSLISSESSRNRLQAASRAARSSASIDRAESSCAGSVTTSLIVVPMAFHSAQRRSDNVGPWVEVVPVDVVPVDVVPVDVVVSIEMEFIK